MSIGEINDKKPKYFLLWLICVVLSGIFSIILFVSVIDPYNLYGWIKLDGINTLKPQFNRYIEEIKLTQAIKLNPNFLIFGNSRAEIGFDPESSVLSEHGYSAYNFAIRGTSIAVSHRQLDYLLSHGIKPKRILIALDFVDFLVAPVTAKNKTKPSEEVVEDCQIDRWFWRFDSIFSMTSLKDALHTLAIQSDQDTPTMTTRGFNPLREYPAIARKEGYFVLFQQRAEENVKTYSRKSAGTFDRTGYVHLRSMLNKAVDAGSEVVVITYPYHAQLLALLEYTGLLAHFADWKKEIVVEVENITHKKINAKIKLVDFSGYNPYQCETIPSKGDLQAITRWYWEAGHFKQALGEIILERVIDLFENSSSKTVKYFGIELNSNVLDDNADRMNAEKNQCHGRYPQLFDKSKALVQRLSTNNHFSINK